MRPIILTVFLSILAFSSCNSEHSKKPNSEAFPYRIDVEKNISNLKAVPLSSIGNRLEYIALETTTESMLARALKIEITDSLIFVSDGAKIFEFDNNGRYVKKIGVQGRGPREYLTLCDFCIDGSSRRIYILDEMALLVFDFEGKFIESSRLPFLSLSFTLKDKNNLIYYSTNLPGLTTDSVYSWFVSDCHGKNIIKYKNHHQRKNKGMAIGDSPLYLFEESPRFMEFGSDTLLHFRNSKPDAYAIFALGNMKMETDLIITRANSRDVFINLKQKLWTRIISEDKTNIYTTLFWGHSDSSSKCVYNKITSETFFLENNGFINDLDEGLSFWPKYIYQDSILVDQTDAFKLIKRIKEVKSSNKNPLITEQLESLSKLLTDNSNPVLIVLK